MVIVTAEEKKSLFASRLFFFIICRQAQFLIEAHAVYEVSTPGERKNGDLVLTPAAPEGSQLQTVAKDK